MAQTQIKLWVSEEEWNGEVEQIVYRDGERREVGEWEQAVMLPAKNVVCERCHGEGVHDHPAFANGITSSEMDEAGPEFLEDYMSGMYDVRCEECRGNRVVKEIDEERLTEEQKALVELLYKQEAERARERAEDRYTMMMESGGYRY